MPLYDYECSCCEHLVEDVFQKPDDTPLKKCPECGKMKLFRVVTGGIHGSVRSINTIGQLADHNTKKNRSMIEEAAAKKFEETPKAPEAWYENKKYTGGVTIKDINKMSKQQQFRYIMEGK